MPATAARSAAAAQKPTKPRVYERQRFVDAVKSRLIVMLRRYRGGFLTYVDHQPVGETMRRGAVVQHDTEAAARAEFDKQMATARANGWRQPYALPESTFTELPKAAAAAAAQPTSTPLAQFPKRGRKQRQQ